MTELPAKRWLNVVVTVIATALLVISQIEPVMQALPLPDWALMAVGMAKLWLVRSRAVLEVVTGEDLDGDGYIGNPPPEAEDDAPENHSGSWERVETDPVRPEPDLRDRMESDDD